MNRNIYLVLAILGFALPYYFLASFLVASGPDLGAFVKELFATKISSFFAADLLISAVVFLVYLRREARRYDMGRWWIYLVATLLVGLSFAFPLFLYVRESSISRMRSEASR